MDIEVDHLKDARIGIKPVGEYYDNMKRRHIRHSSQSKFTMYVGECEK